MSRSELRSEHERANMSSRSATQNTSLFADQGVASSVTVTRVGFLVIVACLLVFGLVMLYSASSIYSYNMFGDYSATFFKQTIFVAIGLGVALVVALVPYDKYTLPLCAGALMITIPLLALVLTEGSDALGARRWIDLGFTTLQPSEFSKIALILVMAHLVDRCRNNGYSPQLIVVMILACAIPIGLIIVEPDLGTTIIAVIGILTVLWFGGVPKRIVVAIAIGLVILAVIAISGSGFRQNRISSWRDPWSDPQDSGYQLLNSYYAFGGGGVFGVGLGLSKQKFSWLPQSENDFIFAIVGEELGLFGALLVVVLFIGLVFMALKIARNAPDPFGAMIAGSSGVIIGLQAFLNMLCVVGALPTTGKPLPFFSAGGSSIITTMILVGLIFSVSLRSTQANVHDFRREQFSIVNGGRHKGAQLGGAGSALSWLPNPAAIVGALLPRHQVQDRRERPDVGRTAVSTRVSPTTPSDKVVPISRGRAERAMREKEELRRKRTSEFQPDPSQRRARAGARAGARAEACAGARAGARAEARAEAPISMASLRRNYVHRIEDRSA